jgi:flagellar protein FlaG
MPISTTSMRTPDGLQLSQGTTPAARAAGMPGDVYEPPAPKAVAHAKASEADKPGAGQLQQSLEDINKVLTGFSISVQFEIDPAYSELIVKVVDQDTGKLIRQIPTEEVVKMSKAMDNLKGLLFAQSV